MGDQGDNVTGIRGVGDKISIGFADGETPTRGPLKGLSPLEFFECKEIEEVEWTADLALQRALCIYSFIGLAEKFPSVAKSITIWRNPMPESLRHQDDIASIMSTINSFQKETNV